MIRVLDAYSLQARVAPFFITILPIILLINLFAPNALGIPFKIGLIFINLAIAILAAQFARHGGKKKELKLWASWDGPPTTRFLRHSNIEFNSVRRRRCQQKLQMVLPDLKIPSKVEEEDDPTNADNVYEACTRYLIEKTRNKNKFPLIFKENVHYGFIRNLWGLKPIGLAFSIIAIFISTYFSVMEWNNMASISVDILVVGGISVMIMVMWIFWVRPETIKIVSETYAERLLDYCEHMDV